ncbi:toll/interleukin-1 receptor domain-containing protein [Anabaena sp. UHCC 0399]|uniref:toll/interleukin-1 receptor domain-containing protein n=1 Tax=Anabaena sp. UHCC 0399 TaxID=3110238 RepID=UPI002B20A1BF|nr:toll/interleukin-1 receptor domain-containing protein [Anabaena sp. UHCC 0399]MEA5566293.1 toll/interleukin-1 receptor domain-containing protein [Anabaena sp. UHCC 0399]
MMIFISYSWADSMFARSLANFLTKEGYQVWIDYQNLNTSKPLVPQVAKAISVADVFLYIDSLHARSSKWVKFELCLAQICSKLIQVVNVPL